MKDKYLQAKAAHDKAVADKKDAAEIATLKTAMDTAFAALSADEKAAVEGKGAVTLADIKAIVVEAVEPMLKNLAPQGVNKETIVAAVAAAFAQHEQAKTMPKNDEIKSIVAQVVADQAKALTAPRTQPKQLGHVEGGEQMHTVTSLRKDALPVYLKQLLNIMVWGCKHEGEAPDFVMNKDIRDSDLLDAQTKGANRVAALKAKSMGMSPVEFLMSRKALATADNGDLIPVDLSSELYRRLYLESALAALFASREIEMPSAEYRLPLTTTLPAFGLYSAENTLSIGGDPGTAGILLTAKKVMGRSDYSYEVDEDSIVPILMLVIQSLAQSAGLTLDSMIINGDTSSPHMDTDTAANTGLPINVVAAEKAWKGLRKLALAASLAVDFSTGGISDANLRSLRKKLGKYGLKLNGATVWIPGAKGYNDMTGLPNAQTIYAYGPQATVHTGELSQYGGLPIIASEKAREDLNASGVYDGSTVTKGSLLCANLERFLMGNRRTFTVETFRDIKLQQTNIVAAFRKAFTPIETPSSTVPSVAVGYNYAS